MNGSTTMTVVEMRRTGEGKAQLTLRPTDVKGTPARDLTLVVPEKQMPAYLNGEFTVTWKHSPPTAGGGSA